MVNKEDSLSLAEASEHLAYDPDTGVFVRLKSLRVASIGRPAGTVNKIGYLVVCIGYTQYSCHRLAWLFATGKWPLGIIDHVNGVKSDNRISNLREATHSKNMANSRGSRDGLKGAYPHGSGFRSRIGCGGIDHCLGTFRTEEEAHEAYMVKARELFGEFARGS